MKRALALSSGMVAGSVRGTLKTSDFTFKHLTSMLTPKSTFMSTVDDIAGYFGGITDHTVGDELLKYLLKATTILYNLTSKTLRTINDGTEKTIKNMVLSSRLQNRQR